MFHSVMAFPDAVQGQRLRGSSSPFAAGRPGDFEAEGRAKLGRFAGHFGRASSDANGPRTDFGTDSPPANFLLDEGRDAILLIDREARPVHANAAARAMLDAGPTEYGLVRGRLQASGSLRPTRDSCVWRRCAATAKFALAGPPGAR